MGDIEAIIAGTHKLFCIGVIEETAIRLAVVADEYCFYCLRREGIAFDGVIDFDISNTEKRKELAVIRLLSVCFEKGSGERTCIRFYREIVTELDCIVYGKEPEVG